MLNDDQFAVMKLPPPSPWKEPKPNLITGLGPFGLFAVAGVGDEFLDVVGAKQNRVADPVMGNSSRLGHPIPPPFRHLSSQIPALCLGHGYEGIFMFNLLEMQHGRREAAT